MSRASSAQAPKYPGGRSYILGGIQRVEIGKKNSLKPLPLNQTSMDPEYLPDKAIEHILFQSKKKSKNMKKPL